MSEPTYPQQPKQQTVSPTIVGLKTYEDEASGGFYIIGHLAEGKGSSEWRALAQFDSEAEASETLARWLQERQDEDDYLDALTHGAV